MKDHAKPSDRIVFFGDSVCVGQGISIHRGWVTRIASRIEDWSRETGHELVVVNASINGNTTRQALERMPYDVQSHGAGILLVQFGMNDCNYWLSDRGVPRVSPNAFDANLEEIVHRGIAFGARAVLLNTNHPTTRTIEHLPGAMKTYEESNSLYNQIIRDVASRLGGLVMLNDIERAFLDLSGGSRDRLQRLLLDDGLHLSVAGHDLYYQLIAPRIEAALLDVYGPGPGRPGVRA
jgi:lysophospholipase L1-like esterase